MWSPTWLAHVAALTCAQLGLPPLPAQTGGNTNTQFISQLKTQFDKADLNQDTYLDKDELAKAFRGPKAKSPEQGMYDDQGRLTKTYYEASKKYPDLVLLWAADTDNDELVSWPEYKTYELNLLAAQRQQQQALQRAYQSALRSLATGSRRYGRGSSNRYRRNSSAYSGPARQLAYVQRSINNQQQQMVHAAQNWQRMQMQAMANYQRMYRQAMLQRLQMQQAMLANYVRQQKSATHRVVQRHQNPAVRHVARRR